MVEEAKKTVTENRARQEVKENGQRFKDDDKQMETLMPAKGNTERRSI